jgi:D-alanine-D-alanine ligase
MSGKRVGVVMGGTSAEREVSLRSGKSVARALAEAGHDVVAIDIQDPADAWGKLNRAHLDAAFLALHGRLGEDGCIQGLLETMGVPYTGSGVLGSALAMDKLKAKELFRLHNVPTPPYYVFDANTPIDEALELHGSFGFPVVVKPRREGSSIGMRVVHSAAELTAALTEARRHDDSILVERFVAAKEVAVGILDGRVLGAIEIAPEGGIYDYQAKYASKTTQYYMPARLSAQRYRNVLNLAERAAQALEVRGAVRVDLLVTEGQNEYVLEVNTLPGMTETSLLPKIAQAAGFTFSELCETILAGARLDLGMQRRQAPARSDVTTVEVPFSVAV